jgi:hypothetical protein
MSFGIRALALVISKRDDFSRQRATPGTGQLFRLGQAVNPGK